MSDTILSLDGVAVDYATQRGWLRAVDDFSLKLNAGQTLGLVGESGSGKSTIGHAILGLTRFSGGRVSGGIRFAGQDLLTLGEPQWRSLRGDRIAIVFQDPTTTLNPVLKIGDQIAETFRHHRPKMSRREVRDRVLSMVESVGIVDPVRRLQSYPSELSGGMRQRIVIACALALEPALLVADEPTTALDVTVQAQVLELMKRLVRQNGTALILISHDLDVIADTCDDVAVMYAGRIVEHGPSAGVLASPRHPYTTRLLASRPVLGSKRPLSPIPGSVPELSRLPSGCSFHPRCFRAQPECADRVPRLTTSEKGAVACHFPT